jgi:hypothetical protein
LLSNKVSNTFIFNYLDISKFYQFGKILGIGTFGLIREAVPIKYVNNSIQKEAQSSSVFEDPNIQTFAVKTLKKSQRNVKEKILPNEVTSLLLIN